MSIFLPEFSPGEHSNCLTKLDTDGYVILPSIEPNDLNFITAAVSSSFLKTMNKNGYNGDCSIDSYHEAQLSNHSDVWTKRNRTLCNYHTTNITKLKYFRSLFDSLKLKYITDEQRLGYPNLYYRLIRPGDMDIGSLHADSWFWQIDGHQLRPDSRRLKIWIPLLTAGQDAFLFIPRSQNNPQKYRWEIIDSYGMKKPKLISAIDEPICSHGSKPGSPILFHDNLIHGGRPILNHTRVSIEFTIVI